MRSATSPLHTLLGAVRRRLWRGRFVAAIRLALWGSAGLMLLAVPVHLAARQVSGSAVLMAAVVLWVSTLARAAWQRPADSACALWADRHLGGASAFTTWLDAGRGGVPASANPQALHWLESWATARVPDGLRLLAQRPEPMRLSRALLSTGVCAALASVVLTLPGAAPASRQPAVVSPTSGADERPAPMSEAPASPELVKEMASALRSAQSQEAPERRGGGRAPAAGPAGKNDDGQGPSATQAGATPAGERAAASPSSRGTAVDGAPQPGVAQSAGTGSGRDAGDSRDDRADVGVSRAQRGTIAVQRSEAKARRPSTHRQADMDRLAAFDDELAGRGAAAIRAGPSPAAATPPPAIESARLSPTETTYVQAWMKASARRR